MVSNTFLPVNLNSVHSANVYTTLYFVVIGLVIGALLVTLASWPWVFYFIAIVGVLIAASILILVPSQGSRNIPIGEKATRFKRLDLPGVGLLTGMNRKLYL